ncbi:hypothetical protein BURK1_01123 [Burkholderiales bacterium]|nr:hypothetical protein BURK1_01123 [Burkholderiales bacterium]
MTGATGTGGRPGEADGVRGPIPLSGPLFAGRCVAVGWPEAHEYDRITALRNRDGVRNRFLDPRPLDLARNREWLAHGMPRPREAVLAIRLSASGTFVGAIGWSGYDPARAELELGRVMVDARALHSHRQAFPAGYPGVAADAGMALRDFAFGRMGVRRMTSVVIGDNALSRRAVLLGGARPVDSVTVTRADGTEVALLRLEMTRDEWRALAGGGAARGEEP